MQTEYEARFLAIDVDKTITALQDLGAEIHQPRTLMRRVVFKNGDIAERGGWLRLRDEGHQVTLTYKQSTADESAIDTILEAEVVVSDFDGTHHLLTAMGFQALRYQENYREEWRLGELRFDFDTWPDLPTFLEVEGPSADSVEEAAAKLGLDLAHAAYGSVDEVYAEVLGRDILAEPQLVFPDAAELDHASPS
ncbi:adenylate cyclase class 2 [Streptacidiphilus sp. BW17]|uniref:class IV adenylate cyclase n=1 Tax=unclassified Streptacidiphilus TaxID=2643834 RepID=UPI003518F20C